MLVSIYEWMKPFKTSRKNVSFVSSLLLFVAIFKKFQLIWFICLCNAIKSRKRLFVHLQLLSDEKVHHHYTSFAVHLNQKKKQNRHHRHDEFVSLSFFFFCTSNERNQTFNQNKEKEKMSWMVHDWFLRGKSLAILATSRWWFSYSLHNMNLLNVWKNLSKTSAKLGEGR